MVQRAGTRYHERELCASLQILLMRDDLVDDECGLLMLLSLELASGGICSVKCGVCQACRSGLMILLGALEPVYQPAVSGCCHMTPHYSCDESVQPRLQLLCGVCCIHVAYLPGAQTGNVTWTSRFQLVHTNILNL